MEEKGKQDDVACFLMALTGRAECFLAGPRKIKVCLSVVCGG